MKNHFVKTTMQRNSCIDFFRALMAFLVVCIHISFPGRLWEILFPICRAAVPFFFLASGYFNQLTFEKSSSKTKQIKRITWLVLYSNLFFFVYHLSLETLGGGNAVGYIRDCFSPGNIARFVVFNSSQFEGSLWFLGTLLYCLIFAFWARKYRFANLVFWLIPLLLTINIIFGKYAFFLFGRNLPWSAIRNVLFVGIPYFFLGVFIQKNQRSVEVFLNRKTLVVASFLFYLTMILENQIHLRLNPGGVTDFYISLPFFTVAVFLCCILFPTLGKKSYLTTIGAKYSLMIYIIHPIFIDAFEYLNDRFHFSLLCEYFGPPIVFGCALIFSIVYYRLKQPAKRPSTAIRVKETNDRTDSCSNN